MFKFITILILAFYYIVNIHCNFDCIIALKWLFKNVTKAMTKNLLTSADLKKFTVNFIFILNLKEIMCMSRYMQLVFKSKIFIKLTLKNSHQTRYTYEICTKFIYNLHKSWSKRVQHKDSLLYFDVSDTIIFTSHA